MINVPYLNLDQIYNSGQVFSWIKFRDQKYVIPFKDQALKVEQQKDRLIMNCNEEQFYDIWYKYFDMHNVVAEALDLLKREGLRAKN